MLLCLYPALGINCQSYIYPGRHHTRPCQRRQIPWSYPQQGLKMGQAHTAYIMQAFISLVRSRLEYSAAAWDPYLAQDINKFEMVKRRGAHYVKQQFDYRASITDILNQLGWIPLVQRRREARLALMYKIVQGKVAIPVDSILTLADQRTRKKHRYNTDIWFPIRNNTETLCFPRSIPDWTSLAESTVCADSTDAFRTRLRASP